MQQAEFWNIRFATAVRSMFSRIPRGEAAQFDDAVQRLRSGPHTIANVEKIDDNLYQYSANGFRIAFQFVDDAPQTVRIVAFRKEQ